EARGARGGRLSRPPLPPPIFTGPLVARREATGGLVRAGKALLQRLRAEKDSGSVHLLNSGTAVPELDNLCAVEGLVRYSLGRQETPVNLICPAANLGLPAADRIIVKGRLGAPPGWLEDTHRQAVARTSAHARAVASGSSND